MASSIVIVRHGDRFDFDIGEKAWREMCAESNVKIYDPPLSDMGNTMAHETAQALSSPNFKHGPFDRIITSPFLRCIETANPIAGRMGKNQQLLVDDSLFEVYYTAEVLPTLQERAAYFPRVQVTYSSVFKPAADESFPEGALERYGRAAEELSRRFAGENICIVTHAAGVVGIVAALLRCKVSEIPAAGPCSIFRIVRGGVPEGEQTDGSGGEYSLDPDFLGSMRHLTSIGKTYPWPDSSKAEDTWGLQYLAAGDSASWLAK